MNTEIYKSLKETLTSASGINNRSIIELCITELSAGNFPKAVDVSDELIKKDINDSVGWGLKALSQAYLFDYADKLFYLKSSLTSLNEFMTRSKLSQKDKTIIESLFYITVLERTIMLVNERIHEVVELRRKALANMQYAAISDIATIFSAYEGAKAKTSFGTVLGISGAAAGLAASSHFSNTAQLFDNASKGVFGVAVANIAFTISYSQKLKTNLSELNDAFHHEATIALHNWLSVVAILYSHVIENLLTYTLIKRKGNEYYGVVQELCNSHEVVQFVYLSKMLGVDKSIKSFTSIEKKINKIKQANLDQIQKDNSTKFYYTMGGIIGGMLPMSIFLSLDLLPIGIIVYLLIAGYSIYYLVTPSGEDDELRTNFESFSEEIKRFKLSADKLIIENMAGIGTKI